MDLRGYYEKIRKAAQEITTADVVVVSLETSDGGHAGVKTEVPRAVAARMIVEGRARLADAAETETYRHGVQESKQAADEAAASARVKLAVVPEQELAELRGAAKQPKK